MKSKLTNIVLSSALGLAAMLLTGSVHAAPWTFTTSGTIGYGSDNSGTFFGGTATDLTGQSFTLTTTVDPSLYSFQSSRANDHYGLCYSCSNPYSETLTINGVTQTFIADTNSSFGESFGESYLSNWITHGYYDQAYQAQSGYSSNGTYLGGVQVVFSYINAMNLGLNYNQVWSYTPLSSDDQITYFDLSGIDGSVYFRTFGGANGGNNGTITNISINAQDPTNVPEPTSLALMGAALVGLVGVQRKRAQKRKTLVA